MTHSEEDILHFISASFPSVWALELAILLKREDRAMRKSEIVSNLRASEVVVNKALQALMAAGLASIDGESVRYLSANRDLEECMERAEQLYRSRPNLVRRAIVMAGASGAAAFADAFKLRKSEE